MTEGADADKLATTRQFVVILRIVVEASGRVSGEFVDPIIERSHRFVGIAALSDALRTWLDETLKSPGSIE